MNGSKITRMQRPDAGDETRTVRIGLPPHVQERMRKLYGEPGLDASMDGANQPSAWTFAGWIARQLGR